MHNTLNSSILSLQQIPSTENEILSQLYIALLGEECIYMRLKVSGLEFRILEETTKSLSFEMTMILEKIANIASDVKFIEIFRRKRTPSDSFDEYSNEITKNNATLEIDPIKKAILESVFNEYRVYQTKVDEMRMEHISTKDKRPLQQVIQFALVWHRRLRFIKCFLTTLVEVESGIKFLNDLFIEWTLNCSKNWEYGLIVRALRHASIVLTSEFENEQCRKLLLNSLMPNIWNSPAGREIFGNALNKLREIANAEDKRYELMKTQRLVDHLALVHTYFFMLRGDLFAELERIIQVNFVKSSALYYQTPISLRRRTSNSSKITEFLMNEALGKCSPPSNCADLMPLLSSDKAPTNRGKTFYESFGLAYDAKWNMKNRGESMKAMASVFSRDMLRIYKKVFRFSVNLQLLRFHLDEIALRFTHKICPKIKNAGGKVDRSVIFFIHFNLQNVRQYLTRLANYFFEDVLLQETASILARVKKELDFDISMLNRVVKAFGLCRQSGQLFDTIMLTIKTARCFVNSVEDFCDKLDAMVEECTYTKVNQLSTSMVEFRKEIEAKASRVKSSPGAVLLDSIRHYASKLNEQLAKLRECGAELLSTSMQKQVQAATLYFQQLDDMFSKAQTIDQVKQEFVDEAKQNGSVDADGGR